MKNPPSYAVASVDHALQLATILQTEGPLSVSDAAKRLGVARSTAHRLLSMLVYRDFAVQDGNRRYTAGPVLSLGAVTRTRTALLRTTAMPHLAALAERVDESTNLQILTGDHVRFIGSVECRRALRVGNREGMVFPAHLSSGGKLMLAELPDAQLDAFYAPGKSTGRVDARPDLVALRAELRAARHRGFALNMGQTEVGVVAIGRVVRIGDEPADAAISISLPTVRFAESDLPFYVGALTATAHDIERGMTAALARDRGR